MATRTLQSILAVAAILSFSVACGEGAAKGSPWQEKFELSSCKLLTTGRNQYFVMEPGYQVVLEGGGTKLQITVLNETKTVDGVATRVVEEKEWKDGKLAEISRNYFAMCAQTKDVFYFGEDVDLYKNGKVADHEGTWTAGKAGAKPGLFMPSRPLLGARFYQEIAPKVAMDRVEVVSTDETVTTPAGTFHHCVHLKETTPMEPDVSHKYYAPGVGMIKDDEFELAEKS